MIFTPREDVQKKAHTHIKTLMKYSWLSTEQ